MTQIGPDEWLEAEQRDRDVSRTRLSGMYLAGPWTVVPAIAALPIIAVAGEGDYIIVVLGVLWLALLAGAFYVRRRSDVGTVGRSCATWVASYSGALAVMMFAMAIAIAS